jgi:hypothetical protein
MLDLSIPIRNAIIADAEVAAELPDYLGSLPVFTRTPVPENAPYPMMIIRPDLAISDTDMVNDQVPVIVRDIAIYGSNTDASSYFAVERIAYLVRDLFHRRPISLDAAGWRIIEIRAAGPIPAPTDDDLTVGRVVTLTVRATPAA